MRKFLFRAIDPDGRSVRGELEAVDRTHALDQLAANGRVAISVQLAGGGGGAPGFLSGALRSRSAEFRKFVQSLAPLLSAGLTLERALTILMSLAGNRQGALRIQQVRDNVRAGAPLSKSVSHLIPARSAHFEHLIAAGELSGHLPETLTNLGRMMARSKALHDRIFSALAYPMLLFVTMAALLWIVFDTVLPRLTPIFADARAQLPLSTEFLLAVGADLRAYGLPLLLVALAGAIALTYLLRQDKFRLGLARLVIQTRLLFGLPKAYVAAQFCRVVHTLLVGGMALDQTLRAAKWAVGNPWLRRELVSVNEEVEGGRRFSQVLADAALFPPLVAELAAVGEETGRLPALLEEAANTLQSDVETRLDRIVALILPLATLVMGLLVGGVMFAIVSGLLAVNDVAL